MNQTAQNLQSAALKSVREEFGIPRTISLVGGKGVGRILVSAAIAAPDRLLQAVEALEKAYPDLRTDFSRKLLKGVSLVGGLIAERPQLMSNLDFQDQWYLYGLRRAIELAVNPLFRDHIHLLVRVQVAYCEDHKLDCRTVAPTAHRNHLEPLRYILHAYPAIKPKGSWRS
jgi:hypothetical protein